MTSTPGRRVLLQYLALATVWGASFLFIKVGLEGLSPAQIVLGRLTTGALALVLVSLLTRRALPRDAVVWGHMLVVALLLCVVPFLLFCWAETRISSGLASIYTRATPSLTYVAPHCARPVAVTGRPLRIGFLSRFFHSHTIGRLNRGLIRQLSRADFRVILLRPPGKDDPLEAGDELLFVAAPDREQQLEDLLSPHH